MFAFCGGHMFVIFLITFFLFNFPSKKMQDFFAFKVENVGVIYKFEYLSKMT